MRYLAVGDTEIEMSDAVASELLKSGAIYECGAEHDLHLTPDHKFHLGEVELLMNPNP